MWKMGEPFCKTQSNPVVAPWSNRFWLAQQCRPLPPSPRTSWLSVAMLRFHMAFLLIVGLVGEGIKVADDTATQTRCHSSGVCVAVSSATLTPSPTNPTISRNAMWKRNMATDNQLVRGLGGSGRHCWANQKRLIFFCVQIYLHLWMYLSTPLTHLQNGIPHLLQNGGAWYWHMILFSYKVMLGVYKQIFFYKMECPDGTQISIKTDL